MKRNVKNGIIKGLKQMLVSGRGRLAIGLIWVALLSFSALADDTEIYFPSTVASEPNILFIISNNSTMKGGIGGTPFDSTWCSVATGGCNSNAGYSTTNQYYNTTYPDTGVCQGGSCSTYTIYSLNTQTQKWTNTTLTLSGICSTAASALEITGSYTGIYATQGNTTNCATNGNTSRLAMGNYINWANSASTLSSPKISIVQSVLNNVVLHTMGAKFGLMDYNGPNGGIIESSTVAGVAYNASVNDMDAVFATTNPVGSTTNRYGLVGTITNTANTILNSAVGNTSAPMAETLWEASQYFRGDKSSFQSNVTYTTPIQSSCQQNVVIYIADGISTNDRFNNASPTFLAAGICNGAGDCDTDGFEPNYWNYPNNGTHYLDDVAKYIADNGVPVVNAPRNGTMAGQTTLTPGIKTYTIGLGANFTSCPTTTPATDLNSSATDLICRTSDSTHGQGGYVYAGNATDLANAIDKIVIDVLVTNSSFVAPVVPASPNNRSTSGSYIYTGLFKPQNGSFWLGNLKKYKIDTNGTIYDVNGNVATQIDPATGYTIFKSTAQSYWSSGIDGGAVDLGGSGAILQAMTLSNRKIYTFLPGNSTDLTNASNAFAASNTAITPAVLNVTTTAAAYSVIQYTYGYDAYSLTPSNTRQWILGDILHSRPYVLTYQSYTPTTSLPTGNGSVGDCTLNKTIIYVGANDGMLHAFRDCDGSEAWAFIPPDLLPALQNVATGVITPPSRSFYYVDSSPRAYLYDANGDGNISTASNGGCVANTTNCDQAVLIFGERRGGSFYYALDVTDPVKPKFLWQLNIATMKVYYNGVTSGAGCNYGNAYPGLECGGLSFSEPVIGEVLLNNTPQTLFFIGGGYDVLEDCRTANTYMVPCSSTSYDKAGRGVFAFDVLTGAKVWENSWNATSWWLPKYSIPSEVTIFDSNGDGYFDTLYVGDVGGYMYKFNTGASTTSSWSGSTFFDSNNLTYNAGSADQGRKIFFPPDVTVELAGYNMLFFGTGDREHPKSASTSIIDREYAVQDRAPSAGVITESPTGSYLLKDATSGAVTLSSLTDYGWFIKLNVSLGEKVLSSATVFDKVAYYTTYVPPALNAPPCVINLGTANLWAINYLTADSVFNFNSNGGRTFTLGNGIPSGVVIGIINSNSFAIIGTGGAVTQVQTLAGGTIVPRYWHEVR